MAQNAGLKRVAQVYGLLERIRAAELSVASGAVLEVEQAKQLEAATYAEHAGVGRAALMLGDRAEWALAHAQQEAARVKTEKLEQVRAARETVRENAVVAYRQSRLESQQVECTLHQERLRLHLESDRREQNAADDRYLSRREWLRGQTEDDSPDA
jgi:hypothetical protein